MDYAGRAPGRAGLHHATIAPYGAYPCGDGRQVVLAIQNEREWQRFCADVLGQPALAADPRFAGNAARCANRPALDAEIGRVFGSLTAAEVIVRLDAAGTAYASLNEVADLSVHPQLRRVDVDTPTGPVTLPAPPVRWRDRAAPAGAVPGIGADGAAIRAEFAERLPE